MSMNAQRSDSTHYLLTKWFEKVSAKNLEYTELLSEHINTSNKMILELAYDLEKMMGKIITREAITKKEELLQNISEIEPVNIELIEFIHSFKALLEEINGFDFNFSSQKNLLKLINSEIDFHDNLMVSLRDLIKSINAVFRAQGRLNKRHEGEFNQYLKNYSRLLGNLEKGFNNFESDSQVLLSELNSEIEHAKKIEENQET